MPSLQSYIFRAIIRATVQKTLAITDIAELRKAMSFGPHKPYLPHRASLHPAHAEGFAAQWISPSPAITQPVILYLHGGAWVLGWNNSGLGMAAHLSQAAKSRALALDYRLAPEHPFPAALDDCLAAYRWLLQTGTPPPQIVIAGDSAGGNLTLATLLALRENGDPLPAAAICLSPVTDLALTGETLTTQADPVITLAFLTTMARHYIGASDPRHPLISPLYARLDGLPPLLIQVGADEILLSDAVRLAEKARAAGVRVELSIWPRMWHVWQAFVPFLPEARQAINAIGAFIQAATTSPGEA
jgi:acetyl esterase/lipase